MAAWPEGATRTSYPRCRSIVASSLRTIRSSSTIRIVTYITEQGSCRCEPPPRKVPRPARAGGELRQKVRWRVSTGVLWRRGRSRAQRGEERLGDDRLEQVRLEPGRERFLHFRGHAVGRQRDEPR